jgi:hypothetical protein
VVGIDDGVSIRFGQIASLLSTGSHNISYNEFQGCRVVAG